MKKKLKIMSLFAGCGGFDLGFERAESDRYNFRVVWANDNFKPACETFRKNFSSQISEEDVWTVDFKKVPDCDVVLAGFPCQDFSVLSKREGMNAKRGQLYTRVVDVLKIKRPLFFVAENVKGLLSANKGEAIKIIHKHFEDAGYKVKYKLIRFVKYGIPQKRERVVFVGFRKDLDLEYNFPEPTHKEPLTAEDAFEQDLFQKEKRPVEEVPFNNEHQKIADRTVKILDAIPPGGNYKNLEGKVDEKGESLYVKGLMSNIYRRLHQDEPSPTIIANGGGGTWGYHYKEPRSLTNRERARIQTFPDDFEFTGTIGEVRKQIGNAVPPLGAKIIAESILKSLESKSKNL